MPDQFALYSLHCRKHLVWLTLKWCPFSKSTSHFDYEKHFKCIIMHSNANSIYMHSTQTRTHTHTLTYNFIISSYPFLWPCSKLNTTCFVIKLELHEEGKSFWGEKGKTAQILCQNMPILGQTWECLFMQYCQTSAYSCTHTHVLIDIHLWTCTVICSTLRWKWYFMGFMGQKVKMHVPFVKDSYIEMYWNVFYAIWRYKFYSYCCPFLRN